MNPWQRLKKIITGLMLALLITVLALGGGAFLGRFYIRFLIEPGDAGNKANIPALSRNAPAHPLPPLPLYTVQVGGINLGEADAVSLINKLRATGYRPYRTQESPQKILVGLFSQRGGALELSERLTEEGFGARLTTLMLNEKEPVPDQELYPLLLLYTNWLQKTSVIWETYQVGEMPEGFSGILAGSEEIYRKIQAAQSQKAFSRSPVQAQAASLQRSAAQAMVALQVLAEEWTQENYALAQEVLLEVIENYQVLANRRFGGPGL